MSTHMLTLTEFLLARIAEDEEPKRKRVKPEYGGRVSYFSNGFDDPVVLLDGNQVHDPAVEMEVFELVPTTARVLAECEAKRRIVEKHEEHVRGIGEGLSAQTRYVLRILAAVYADHPDYRSEWRP